MTIALELAFRIHIAAIVQVGVHEHRIQHVAFTAGQDYSLGENPNRRFTSDATRFIDLCNSSLHCCADGNYGLSIEHNRVQNSPGKRIALLGGEGRQCLFQFDFERRARGQGQIRLRPSRGREQYHAH